MSATEDTQTRLESTYRYPDILFCSAKLEGVHKEFQKAVGAIVCNYVPEKGALSLISRTDATQKRASMIQNMHFRNISQKAMLLKRTEEAVKQLESTKLHSSGGCV